MLRGTAQTASPVRNTVNAVRLMASTICILANRGCEMGFEAVMSGARDPDGAKSPSGQLEASLVLLEGEGRCSFMVFCLRVRFVASIA